MLRVGVRHACGIHAHPVSVRSVVILGPGGAGKSTFAATLAELTVQLGQECFSSSVRVSPNKARPILAAASRCMVGVTWL